ncbi:MAG TPA: FliH/SctL family protein [Acidimicrobiales bacterium]|nr:FliH/SctL family protein [Acidimicrobiales bacterium]
MPSSGRVLKARNVVFHDPFAVAPVVTVSREEVDAAYQRGLEDGQAGSLAALPRLVSALDEAVADIKASWAQQQVDDRRAIIDLAAELAQWMLGRELEHDPALAVAQVNEAVANVLSDEEITVYVAPELVDVIETNWHPAQHASVQADPTLLRGELRVVAGVSTADLRWAVALDRAREALDAVDGAIDD